MFLGVDGGGTKTAYMLIDKEGKVLSSFTGPASNHLSLGMDGLADLLEEGVMQVLSYAKCDVKDVDFAFFGLPSYGEDSRFTDAMNRLPSRILSHHRYQCDNDMVCGWAGGTAGEAGIHIVAGTGSIGYGESSGSKARCGGWSEIFGDEGSAYWIGREMLTAFTRMADGRQPKTIVYQMLKDYFQLNDDLDICGRVLGEWQSDRTKIAGLAALACESAMHGDAVMRDVFLRAANHLSELVITLTKSLGLNHHSPYVVSYSGGVFNAGELILAPFRQALDTLCPTAVLRQPQLSPVQGAALYAAKMNGTPLSSQAVKALMKN